MGDPEYDTPISVKARFFTSWPTTPPRDGSTGRWAFATTAKPPCGSSPAAEAAAFD